MLTDQQVSDGLAFARMKEHHPKAWAALERLIARMRTDAAERFADSDSLDKAWLKGARETLAQVLPAMEQLAEDAQAEVVESQNPEVQAGEMRGSDDLAIG